MIGSGWVPPCRHSCSTLSDQTPAGTWVQPQWMIGPYQLRLRPAGRTATLSPVIRLGPADKRPVHRELVGGISVVEVLVLDLVVPTAGLVVDHGVVRPACSEHLGRCLHAGCLTSAGPHQHCHIALLHTHSGCRQTHRWQCIKPRVQCRLAICGRAAVEHPRQSPPQRTCQSPQACS